MVIWRHTGSIDHEKSRRHVYIASTGIVKNFVVLAGHISVCHTHLCLEITNNSHFVIQPYIDLERNFPKLLPLLIKISRRKCFCIFRVTSFELVVCFQPILDDHVVVFLDLVSTYLGHQGRFSNCCRFSRSAINAG